MLETLLFFVHSALLLIFGILCTAAFSGIRPTRKNTALLFSLVALCGGVKSAKLDGTALALDGDEAYYREFFIPGICVTGGLAGCLSLAECIIETF